jgi:uncharacterized protein YqgV (UPF0045/DUF77 family)
MRITAEVSLYPLKTSDVTPAVVMFVNSVREAGLEVQPGRLSTLVSGESAAVFAALQRAYEQCCAEGAAVLVVKATNIGPPSEGSDR